MSELKPYDMVKFMHKGKECVGELYKKTESGKWLISDDERWDTGYWLKSENELTPLVSSVQKGASR